MDDTYMNDVAVLMYHEVKERERYGMDTGDFEAQIRLVRSLGAATIVPEDIGTPRVSAEKAVMITFDDGYASDCTAALPVLLKHGMKGVSFVTTGFVGRPGYLDWPQVRALKAAGFSVQSHTHSHPLLNLLGDEAVREELRVSKLLLEDRLGGRGLLARASRRGDSAPGRANSEGGRLSFHFQFHPRDKPPAAGPAGGLAPHAGILPHAAARF
jgi:Predicted xylanase/chitin deacetylase